MNSTETATLIVTDDPRIARYLHSILDTNPKRSRPNLIGPFYFTAYTNTKKYIILSTNGHLQVFQNSSVYKWSGIDPKKIIEDENSVIPVLNSFNKKNYYALQKVLQTERINDIILALVPDINAITIGLKEIGNVLQKSRFDRLPKKLLLHTLDPAAILEQLDRLQKFSFEDDKCAEIEHLRSYLDAVISFSITQEITYTIKRCIDLASPSFKELKEILAHDIKESKNLLIPMSRAQALILLLIHANNKLMASAPGLRGDEGPRLAVARIPQHGKPSIHVPLDGVPLADIGQANAFLDAVKDEKHLRIGEITSSEIRISPPPIFDLTGLIEQVSAETDFPTTYTYKILLDLYHSRFISYPNPEFVATGSFTIDHGHLLDTIAGIDEFEEVGRLALEHFKRKDGQPQSDHEHVARTGIFPLLVHGKNSEFFKARPNHWKVFAVIVRRYLLQYFGPAVLTESRIAVKLKAYPGVALKSYKIKEKGFTYYCKEGYLDSYTDFSFDVLKSIEVEGFSTVPTGRPKAFYTDASLLNEIKDYHLGDAVSHLLMIEKLITNNYLQVVNKNLKLTKRGELIAAFLKETFDFIGSLDFTTFFMAKMHEIQAVNTQVEMQAAITSTRKAILVRYLDLFSRSRERTNDYLMQQGINISVGNDGYLDAEQKGRFSISPELHLFCPCGSPMKIIETKTKTRFLACENRLGCGKTAALPKDGKIVVIDKQCKICGKNVLRIESSERGAYFFCPICWMESYSQARGASIGYCATCDSLAECWASEDSAEHGEILAALAARHAGGYDKCPRCQKSRMIVVNDVQGGAPVKMVCENPLCNFMLDVPQAFAGHMERTEKKCFICPMNAILVTVKEGSSFHVCINCYNQYLKRKEEQIGFCLGCVYRDACFTNEVKRIDVKESLKDSVKKRMSNIPSS